MFAKKTQKNLRISKKSSTFVPAIINNALYMETFKKYLGVILLLLGVLCLVIYKLALPTNALLICSMVLEVGGIVAFVFINKALK